MNMKEKRREKKGIYVTVLLMMMLSGVTSFVWGQPIPVVQGNRVEMSDGSGAGETVHGGPIVYGGNIRDGIAKENTARLIRMKNIQEAYGGHVARDGRAEGNELTVTDTTVSVYRPHWSNIGETRGDLCGGKVGNRGKAKRNRIILRGVTSENHGSIYGAWVKIGEVVENEVEIFGGRIILSCTGGKVCGGYVAREGPALRNRITLDHMRLGDWDGHTVDIYGGRGRSGAYQNSVTLREFVTEGDVYGGYTCDGDDGNAGNAIGNEINLEGGVRIRVLYGGWRVVEEGRGPGDAFTGNTLNLRHCVARVGRIGNFEYMNFYTSQNEFLEAAACLTANEEIDLRRVGIRLTMGITDPSTLIGLVGKEKVLMRSEGKIKNFNPSGFTFRTEGNVDAGLPIPVVETCVSFLGKTLVVKVKRLMLPERPTPEDPLIPSERETGPCHCCNVM